MNITAMFILLQLYVVLLLFNYSLAYQMKTKLNFGYVPPSEEEYYSTEDEESAEELIMPNEQVQVVLDDSQLFILLSTLDLPKQFNHKLSKESGGAINGEKSLNALYSRNVFGMYNLFAQSKSPIDSLNKAMARVREHLNNSFKMNLNLKPKQRFVIQNWTYDMFLFRALLEIFEKIYEAAIPRKHILLPQSSIVCSGCVKPYNKPLAPGGYCPITNCTKKADLVAHKLMNDENIAMIADWFDQFKFKKPQEARVWEKQFVVKYLPGRFAVNIVNTEFADNSHEEEEDPYHSYQMKSSFNVGSHKFDANHFGYSNGINHQHNFVYSSPNHPSNPTNYKTKMAFGDPEGKKYRMSTKVAFQNNKYLNSPPKNIQKKFSNPNVMQSKMNLKLPMKQNFGGISHSSHFTASNPFNGYGVKSRVHHYP